jgi:hypothetical protein
MTKRYFLPLALTCLVGIAACGGDAPAEQTELTREQKDSIVADLPIPGASAVGDAMRARDAANERTAAHDSIGGRP